MFENLSTVFYKIKNSILDKIAEQTNEYVYIITSSSCFYNNVCIYD